MAVKYIIIFVDFLHKNWVLNQLLIWQQQLVLFPVGKNGRWRPLPHSLLTNYLDSMHHRHERQPTSFAHILMIVLYLARKIWSPTQVTSNMFKRVSLLVSMHSSILSLSNSDVFEPDKPDQFIQPIYQFNIKDSVVAINPHYHCQITGGIYCNVNNYKKD